MKRKTQMLLVNDFILDQNLTNFANSIPGILLIFHRNTVCEFVNHHFAELTAISAEKAFGRKLHELPFPPHLMVLLDDHIENIFKSGESRELEFDWELDGHKRFFQSIGTLYRAEKSGAEVAILSIRETTASRKKLCELISSTQSTTAARLFGELSHHMNNPLTILTMKLDQVQEDALANSKLESDLKVIRSASDRIGELIKNISKLACLERKSLETSSVVSVSAAVRLAIALCDKNNLMNTIDFSVEGEAEVELRSHLADLVEVLFQVLANAFEAALASKTPWVRIQIEQKKKRVEIAIADSGKKTRSEEFDRFSEAFYTTKGPSRKGMGLSMAKASLFRLSGTLVFDDREDHGTLVTVVLPRPPGA